MNGMMNKCNHVTYTPVFKIGNNQVILGAKGELEDYLVEGGRPGLVIDASGSMNIIAPTPMKIIGSDDPKLVAVTSLSFFRHITLQIDWPDRGIATMTRTFWDALYNYLLNDFKGDIFIHCLGGHGRTGTIASILAHYANVGDDKNPIVFIREKYCHASVESKSQIWYVEQITGVDCTEVYEHDEPVSVRSAYGYPVQEYQSSTVSKQCDGFQYTYPAQTESTKRNNSIVMEVDRSLYQDLNWDSAVNGYLDSDGIFIGSSLVAAVETLRDRKRKAVEETGRAPFL